MRIYLDAAPDALHLAAALAGACGVFLTNDAHLKQTLRLFRRPVFRLRC